jgi:cytoskeletal protein RodZ
MSNTDEEQKTGKVTRRGLLLKETREGRGLSIESVHELTKIPLDVLHAIEEGYTVRMVSAYYFKGFIKMYAKFLGLDASLVLDEPMPEKAPKDENVKISVAADPEHRKFNEYISRQSKKQMIINLIVGGLLAVCVLIIFVVWWGHRPKGQSSPQQQSQSQPVKVKKETPLKKMLEKQNADRKMVDQTKPKPKPEAKVEKKEPVRAVAHVVETPDPEPVVETPSENAKAAAGKKVSLSIKSKAAGWLQVKVDGNLVFQSTLRAGAVESWQADKSIELSGKNVNNLEFEVNGKVLGQLGKSDRGARRVIITKDGLSVKN